MWYIRLKKINEEKRDGDNKKKIKKKCYSIVKKKIMDKDITTLLQFIEWKMIFNLEIILNKKTKTLILRYKNIQKFFLLFICVLNRIGYTIRI